MSRFSRPLNFRAFRNSSANGRVQTSVPAESVDYEFMGDCDNGPHIADLTTGSPQIVDSSNQPLHEGDPAR